MKYNEKLFIAYTAGFFDSSVSLRVTIQKKDTLRYKHELKICLYFPFKTRKHYPFFDKLKKQFGGTIIVAKGSKGSSSYIIQSTNTINEFLKLLLPFLMARKDLCLKILDIIEAKIKVTNVNDFIQLVELVDQFSLYSPFSKYRVPKYSVSLVKQRLSMQPVETLKTI